MRTESTTPHPDITMKPHEHHHASERARDASKSDAPASRGGDPRQPPSKEEVRRFGALMQRAQNSKSSVAQTATATANAVRGEYARDGESGGGAQDQDQSQNAPLLRHDALWAQADAANLLQLQPQLAAATPPPSAAPAFGPALAELIEKHIRQMLVSENTTRGGEVLLRMSDAALPDTDLWLSRTEHGWKLRAQARSKRSYQSILDGSAQLVERFAQRRLGQLEIESSFGGAEE